MVRSLTKHGMPKPFAILIAALLALYFVPLGALPASAQTVGGFEIEGNLVDDPTPGIDWFNLNPGDTGFATDVDHTVGGQDATTFGSGSKEYNDGGQNGWPTWAYGGGNAPGKSDFGRWATYTNTDAASHVWLFLGFDRDAATGTAKYAFELNQVIQDNPDNPNPIRSQGDLRFIVWDQGNGVITLTGDAKNTDVGLYKWVDPDQPAGGVAVDTNQNGSWVKDNSNGTFVGAVNDTPVSVPTWWTSDNVTAQGTILADQFVEFGIDLTSFGAVLGCPSHGFTAVNARSITGTGTTGELVDYLSALPVHIPSTCTSLVTNATGPVVIGNSISDTATITPSSATGTVTFRIYGPDDATCANAPVATLGPINVVNGSASSGPYTPTAVGTYRWIASYTSNDPAHFADTTGACNDPNEQSVVNKKQPAIATHATGGSLPAGSVSDSADLTGTTANAGGSIVFKLYGPSAAPNCDGAAIFTSAAIPVNGPGTYGPVSTTVANAGSYYWIASYSGDANNLPVAGACGAANETSVVTKTSPTITTDADDTATLPDDATVSDTATLSGVTATAGGTIIFKLFGPDSTPGTPTCTEGVGGNLEFTSAAVAVNGPGTYGPVTHTVTKAGTYFWIAYYSGDSNNSAVAGECGDPNETSDVNKASPHISTTAAATGALPDAASISDTAHLTGLTADATGAVTFNVYGPFPADSSPTCSGTPFATLVVTLGSVGADHAIDVASGAVTVTAAGRYYWVASYGGDANNEAVAGACGADNETSIVNATNPVIVTHATGGSLPAGSVSDSADLSGVTANAGGSIVFKLYGPSASPNCDGAAVFTSAAIPVNGSGTYGPVSTTVANAGSYYWIATYSGDANNNSVAGSCGDEGETSVVTKASPAISTVAVATDDLLPGTSVKDTATLTGLTANATGSVTFALYSGTGCSTVVTSLGPIAIGTVSNGTATVSTPAYTGLNAVGTYRFIASYSGDANNNAVAGNCGDANESVTINSVGLNIVKSVSPVAGGGVVVEFGDTLTYTLTVTATGTLSQPNVVVTDYLPGRDPARPSSGKTTYVAGSAACVGAGTCTVTGPDASGLLTWSLGTMAPGTSRQVTFKVTINDVAGAPGTTVAVDILNAGAVQSSLVPKTPSNQVVTPVTKVLPVKVSKPPVVVLPHTGAALPVGPAVGGAIALLGLGLLMLVATARRRDSWLPRR